jgi:ATP-binding cassette subfamily B protein
MIRELFGCIGKKGRATMLGAVLSETGNALIYAAVMLTVFDMLYAVMADPGASLLPHIVRFTWLLAGKFVCTTVSMITMHDAGFELETALKAGIVRRLKRFSLGFYTNEQLGNISTVVHDDIESLRQNTSHMGVSMIADTITALVIGAALFALNPKMGLVMISLLPVSFLLQRVSGGAALRLKNENGKNLGVMVSRFVEFTKNIPMLKTFPGGLLFQTNVKESAADFAVSSKAEARQGAKDMLRYFLPFELCFALIVLIGGALAASGSLSVTDLIYFIVFSQLFYIPFANMESYRLTWAQIKSSFGRVSKLLNAPTVETPELPQKPNGFDIAFRHVCFRYAEDGFELRDADFHLPEGSLTALVGASGSGKTTVMNLLLRFWDAESGSIEVGGVDIRLMDYDEWLSGVSIVM